MSGIETGVTALLAGNLFADNARHGFFTRRGGISQGIYQALNAGLGSDDERTAVMKNRTLATSSLKPGATLCTPYQVHGATVATIKSASASWEPENPPEADAVVTNTTGIAIGIVTADCVPVLFADPQNGVVGAAHAGWKGALNGVIENTIAAMEQLGAQRSDIRVAIGPAIAQASYEVGPELRQEFKTNDASSDRWFVPNDNDRFQFDLVGYVEARLTTADIESVEALRRDTYAEPDEFFSYRRACHQNETGYGRQLSAILLA